MVNRTCNNYFYLSIYQDHKSNTISFEQCPVKNIVLYIVISISAKVLKKKQNKTKKFKHSCLACARPSDSKNVPNWTSHMHERIRCVWSGKGGVCFMHQISWPLLITTSIFKSGTGYLPRLEYKKKKLSAGSVWW